MISARHISLSINGRELLHDIDLDIVPGQFTAVAGPNGAGKSSLLKIVSNETGRYDGTVTINGSPIKKYDIAALSKVRAVLPQSTHLQFPFSVQQIVQLGTHYHRNTRYQNDRIGEEVMELTGVTSWRDRNYLTLSGGEQQRVNLARVLAQVWEVKAHPRYILLDEPTSNLDIAQQQMIFNLVKQSCERNIGVMAIVHDLNQVAQFADKLYFLREGKIIASGATKEVFTKSIIEETFCCRVNVYHDACTNCPYIVPDSSKIESSSLKTANL
ncbi:MAG: heme ABC transporter ATP-binding protein [Cyclobacteriaceae bacterium]|nr:heme ABC transporter ATP-binding protein [Cyclobacteriaceae bacterium]